MHGDHLQRIYKYTRAKKLLRSFLWFGKQFEALFMLWILVAVHFHFIRTVVESEPEPEKLSEETHFFFCITGNFGVFFRVRHFMFIPSPYVDMTHRHIKMRIFLRYSAPYLSFMSNDVEYFALNHTQICCMRK